ncbi:MAG: hypothetical protein PVH88_18135 [Ignavibacteria bacterium]|jgi:hypothetical protein
MFTEITGNTDLYEQYSKHCVQECILSCLSNCEVEETPTAEYRVQDYLREEAGIQP